MSNKINIKFAAQGHPGVIAAVKALNKQVASLTAQNRMLMGAQGPLTKAQQQTANAFAAQTRAARNTGGALSVLRSNMLLATFGATIFAGSILKLSNMAGDAAEQMSKASVVFGGSTDSVLKFADTTAEATGRSRYSLIAMAASVQDILVPMGMLRHEAASLSKEIVKTAIDVASFNNVSESTAMRDFNSALVGNHETVRKYGVVISEARMEQIAYDTGLTDSVRVLTDQEKIMARLAILQKDTTDAQGDAVRTADSYANVLKALSSQAEVTAIVVGQKLMPMIAAFSKVLIGVLKLMTNTKVIVAFAVAITYAGNRFRTSTKGVKMFDAGLKTMMKTLKIAGKAVRRFLVAFIAIEALVFIFEKLFPPIKKTADALFDVEERLNKISDAADDMSLQELKNTLDSSRAGVQSLTDDLEYQKTLLSELQFEEDFGRKKGDLPMQIFDDIREIEAAITSLNETLVTAGQDVEIYSSKWEQATKVSEDFQKAEISIIKLIKEQTDAEILNAMAFDKSSMQYAINATALKHYGMTFDEVSEISQEASGNIGKFVLATTRAFESSATDKITLMTNALGGVSTAQKFLNEAKAAGIPLDDIQIENIEALGAAYDAQKQHLSDIAEAKIILTDILLSDEEKEIAEIDRQIAKLELLKKEKNNIDDITKAIQKLKDAKADLQKTDEKTHSFSMFASQKQKDQINQIADAVAAGISANGKNQKLAAGISSLMAVVNTYEGVTKALATGDYLQAGVVLTQGLASVAQIQAAVGKMGGSSSSSGGGGGGGGETIGGWNDGGYVPSSSGSGMRDDVPAMLTAGEFVMSRNAVESIGLETLNQMNQGGGGSSSINVSISGNVMTQDFVEGELAEAIKEAARRGSDFGLN